MAISSRRKPSPSRRNPATPPDPFAAGSRSWGEAGTTPPRIDYDAPFDWDAYDAELQSLLGDSRETQGELARLLNDAEGPTREKAALKQDAARRDRAIVDQGERLGDAAGMRAATAAARIGLPMAAGVASGGALLPVALATIGATGVSQAAETAMDARADLPIITPRQQLGDFIGSLAGNAVNVPAAGAFVKPGSSRLARAAAGAATGFVEGGLGNVADEVGRSVVAGDELTWDKVQEQLALGSTMGGILGAGFGAASPEIQRPIDQLKELWKQAKVTDLRPQMPGTNTAMQKYRPRPNVAAPESTLAGRRQPQEYGTIVPDEQLDEYVMDVEAREIPPTPLLVDGGGTPQLPPGPGGPPQLPPAGSIIPPPPGGEPPLPPPPSGPAGTLGSGLRGPAAITPTSADVFARPDLQWPSRVNPGEMGGVERTSWLDRVQGTPRPPAPEWDANAELNRMILDDITANEFDVRETGTTLTNPAAEGRVIPLPKPIQFGGVPIGAVDASDPARPRLMPAGKGQPIPVPREVAEALGVSLPDAPEAPREVPTFETTRIPRGADVFRDVDGRPIVRQGEPENPMLGMEPAPVEPYEFRPGQREELEARYGPQYVRQAALNRERAGLPPTEDVPRYEGEPGARRAPLDSDRRLLTQGEPETPPARYRVTDPEGNVVREGEVQPRSREWTDADEAEYQQLAAEARARNAPKPAEPVDDAEYWRKHWADLEAQEKALRNAGRPPRRPLPEDGDLVDEPLTPRTPADDVVRDLDTSALDNIELEDAPRTPIDPVDELMDTDTFKRAQGEPPAKGKKPKFVTTPEGESFKVGDATAFRVKTPDGRDGLELLVDGTSKEQRAALREAGFRPIGKKLVYNVPKAPIEGVRFNTFEEARDFADSVLARPAAAQDAADLPPAGQSTDPTDEDIARMLAEADELDAAADARGDTTPEPNVEFIDPDEETIRNNASGDSSASVEAMNRQRGMQERGEQYVLVDRSGNITPLITTDAVDVPPPPGSTKGIVRRDGTFQLLDGQGRPPKPTEVARIASTLTPPTTSRRLPFSGDNADAALDRGTSTSPETTESTAAGVPEGRANGGDAEDAPVSAPRASAETSGPPRDPVDEMMGEGTPEVDADPVGEGVRYAVTHTQGAEERWRPLVENGATDAEIADRAKSEIGIAGGRLGGGMSVDYRAAGGGTVEVKTPDGTKKLSGKKLIAEIRRVFGIPQPTAKPKAADPVDAEMDAPAPDGFKRNHKGERYTDIEGQEVQGWKVGEKVTNRNGDEGTIQRLYELQPSKYRKDKKEPWWRAEVLWEGKKGQRREMADEHGRTVQGLDLEGQGLMKAKPAETDATPKAEGQEPSGNASGRFASTDYDAAKAHAREQARRLNMDIAVRKVKNGVTGKQEFVVSPASKNDSDYARYEIVSPSDPASTARTTGDEVRPGATADAAPKAQEPPAAPEAPEAPEPKEPFAVSENADGKYVVDPGKDYDIDVGPPTERQWQAENKAKGLQRHRKDGIWPGETVTIDKAKRTIKSLKWHDSDTGGSHFLATLDDGSTHRADALVPKRTKATVDRAFERLRAEGEAKTAQVDARRAKDRPTEPASRPTDELQAQRYDDEAGRFTASVQKKLVPFYHHTSDGWQASPAVMTPHGFGITSSGFNKQYHVVHPGTGLSMGQAKTMKDAEALADVMGRVDSDMLAETSTKVAGKAYYAKLTEAVEAGWLSRDVQTRLVTRGPKFAEMPTAKKPAGKRAPKVSIDEPASVQQAAAAKEADLEGFTEDAAAQVVKAAPRKGDGGTTLGSGFGSLQAMGELFRKDPAAAWFAVRTGGGALLGGLYGEYTEDPDDTFESMVLGAGIGAGSRPMLKLLQKHAPEAVKAMKEVFEKPRQLWTPATGKPVVRRALDPTKDISGFNTTLGMPDRAVPDVFKTVRPILETMDDQLSQLTANHPPEFAEMVRKTYTTEAITAMEALSRQARANNHGQRADYIDSLMKAVRNEPDAVIRAIMRTGLSRDAAMKTVGTAQQAFYNNTLGFAVDSMVGNLTQSAITAVMIGPGDTLRGMRAALTKEGKDATKFLALEKPMGLEDVKSFWDVMDKISNILQVPMRATDTFNRRAAYLGAQQHALKRGASAAEARDFAFDLTGMTQGVPGDLGENPFWREMGPLKALSKYPRLWLGFAADAMTHPDPAVRMRFVGYLGGAALATQLFGMQLMNYVMPRFTGLPFAEAAWDVGKHAFGAYDLDHEMQDHFTVGGPHSALLPRYLEKANAWRGRMMAHGLEDRPIRGRAGQLVRETSAAKDTLSLFGMETTRDSDERQQRSDAYDYVARERQEQTIRSRRAKRNASDALDRGDYKEADEFLSELTGTQRRTFLRERNQTPVERLRRQVPLRSREEFDRQFRR